MRTTCVVHVTRHLQGLQLGKHIDSASRTGSTPRASPALDARLRAAGRVGAALPSHSDASRITMCPVGGGKVSRASAADWARRADSIDRRFNIVKANVVDSLKQFPSRAQVVAGRVAEELSGASSAQRLATEEELRGVLWGVACHHQSGAAVGVSSSCAAGRVAVFSAQPPERLLVANMALGFRHDTATVDECLTVRDALEPHVTYSAARHRNEDDIAALRGIVERMGQLLHDAEGYRRANWESHRRVADASGNRVLAVVYSALVKFLEAELAAALPARSFLGRRRDNLAIHAQLVDAIAVGDATRASALAAHHARVDHYRGEAPDAAASCGQLQAPTHEAGLEGVAAADRGVR